MEGKIKELIKLAEQLEKLLIRIISVVGWLLILINLIIFSILKSLSNNNHEKARCSSGLGSCCNTRSIVLPLFFN